MPWISGKNLASSFSLTLSAIDDQRDCNTDMLRNARKRVTVLNDPLPAADTSKSLLTVANDETKSSIEPMP